MICCLNPGCQLENPSCPDSMQYCSSCGTKLLLLADRYCPVRRIGAGGFGVTYLAEDRQRFNKECVIKQLVVHDPKAKELFEQEAKQLEELGSQSSQIPSLLAYPSDNRYLYLVQEFIKGQNLDKYLAATAIQNEAQIKDFLYALLPILALVHKNRVIHRDIKLDNIMRRDDGKLVLIDFGVSKLISNTLKPGTVAGTPGYAPEEQMSGIVTPASDLYSLGAACFHLLTGKHPYEAFEVDTFRWTSTWQKYLQQPISPGLAKIIDKLLQRNYQNRYQSAADAIAALQELNPPPQQNPPFPTPQQNPPFPNYRQNPPVPSPQQTVRVNPIARGKNTTALAIGAAIALISCLSLIINSQSKNPVGSASQTTPTPVVTTSPSINNPTAEKYYQRGLDLAGKDDKGAIEAFTKAIELKSDYFAAYNDRGLARYQTGDNQGAIEDYTQAIKLKPDSILSYARRGSAFSVLGNKQKAIDDWKYALQLKTDDSDAYRGRGNAKYELGDKNGAIEDYTQAIKLKPDDSNAYNNRGAAKYDLGDKNGAIDDYTQAIKLKPDFSDAYNNRGNAKYDLGDKKGAIVDYTQAIKLKPDFSGAYNNRGAAKYDLGDKNGAIEDYTQAIKLKLDNSDAYYNRGNVKSDLGDKNGAIADYTQAIKLKPDNSDAYYNLGNVKYSLGDKNGAVNYYTQAIKLKPDYSWAYHGRGNAKYVLGDKNGAIEDYSQAAKLFREQGKSKESQAALDRVKELSK